MLVVFGSINIDIVVNTGAFPAPGETLIGNDYTLLHGGKGGNQAVAANLAGVKKTYMVGAVGADDFGDRAMYNLRSQGVVPTGVGRSKRPTGLACICLNDSAENCIIVAPGANQDARADQIPDDFFNVDTVLLMQMEVPHDQNWALAEQARKSGATTILNVAPAGMVPESVLETIDYLIVNELECGQLKSLYKIDETEPDKIAEALAERFNLVCVVTLSDKGSYASDRGKKLYKAHALKVDAVDSTGAGDAFCGVFAASIEKGFDLSYALHRASVAGALACIKEGAQESLPTEGGIEEFIPDCPEPELIKSS